MRNLNIKNDDAYDIAQFIAKRKGTSVTKVVTDLLRKEKRAITKDELVSKWTRIGNETWLRMTPEQRNWDYNAEMYDDQGLPK